jgi:hypothetical protein
MCRGSASQRQLVRFVAAGLMTWSAVARGDPMKQGEAPCAVRLVPADASIEWRRAETDLRQRIDDWPAPDRDCRDLLIQVTSTGAILVITTVDGRQARRQVSKPGELASAASALAVSVESTTVQLSFDETSEAQGTSVQQQSGVERQAQLFAAVGVRLGVPGGFWAPVVRGAAALEAGRWAFGTFVDLAPQHWMSGDGVPPAFSMWSLSSGVAVGGRQPMGRMNLVGGALIAASFVHEQSTKEEIDDGAVEVDVDEGDGVDLQSGAYIGVATNRSNDVRFRAQVELLFPLSHPGTKRELDSDLPSLPGCWFGAVVGAEFGVP